MSLIQSGFYFTYEELKLSFDIEDATDVGGFYFTYEELKLAALLANYR